MSRPVEYGEEADARDVQLLTRVMKRVISDPGRDDRWRAKARALLEDLIVHFVRAHPDEKKRKNGKNGVRTETRE